MTREIPSMNEVMLPCLKLLAAGATNARECLTGLKSQFAMNDEQMMETIPSGLRTRIFDRADWAIFHMMKAGLVDRPKRGFYTVSEDAQKLLNSNVAKLDLKSLQAMPTYSAWKSGQATVEKVAVEGDKFIQPTAEGLTPQEAIEAAFQEIDADLRDDLLAVIYDMPPNRFEQLIVDLLLAMGYGGGDRSMGERIGKSGDGGIDGIINEDALGLDAVYIQAKRYAPENKIGRPALQAFVGSLTGEGANKGVFVTTSDFSKEARDYITRVQHRIVLINGDRLARLMIQHEVGVRARKTYMLRSVDEDYFSEF